MGILLSASQSIVAASKPWATPSWEATERHVNQNREIKMRLRGGRNIETPLAKDITPDHVPSGMDQLLSIRRCQAVNKNKTS
jgi:hypothetical protein